MKEVNICLFRQNLRTIDNQSLNDAVQNAEFVVPLFVLDEASDTCKQWGDAQKWWLFHSLKSLDLSLKKLGSRLILHRGKLRAAIKEISKLVKIKEVHDSPGCSPYEKQKQEELTTFLKGQGISYVFHRDHLLFDPSGIRTNQGQPYKVFTAFWKACLKGQNQIGLPIDRPKALPPCPNIPAENIEDWNLLSPWSDKFHAYWTPGEASALSKFDSFLKNTIQNYSVTRDQPFLHGTSCLSPHLRFGEISPRFIWHEVQKVKTKGIPSKGYDSFLSEIGWREFSYYLLHYFQDLQTENYRKEFNFYPWHEDQNSFDIWSKGMTGYPIVDAGMREIWNTGWMHNRVRMIVASFLTKDLLIDWRRGEKWFWNTLLDADPASNPVNWQWVAGSGLDAAPYFRIFNPTLQSRKFDPQGHYIRKWVPEIAGLADKDIHAPFEASQDDLKKAAVELGKSYPYPIVDHTRARKIALELYKGLK